MTTAFASLPSLDLQGAPCDLRVVDVQKHYDGFRLGPVSLDIPRDSVVGLIGQNGAGKTTLMKGILGTIHLDGGNIELFGLPQGAGRFRERRYLIPRQHDRARCGAHL